MSLDKGDSQQYNAACSAARAGAGQGDAKELPDAERANYRKEAHVWLRLELDRYQQAFNDRPEAVSGWLREWLRQWQQDEDLTSVRTPEALKAFTAEERTDWSKLWDDVSALLAKVDAAPAGAWRVDGKELVQELKDAPCRGLLTFGDPKWTDYTVELEAQTEAGLGEINVLFRAAGQKDCLAAIVGGWQNSHHGFAEFQDGAFQKVLVNSVPGKLEQSNWHRVKVEVRGTKAILFLDGDKVVETTGLTRPAGQVGLRTLETSARFRNIKVTDPEGKVLFEGLPDLK